MHQSGAKIDVRAAITETSHWRKQIKVNINLGLRKKTIQEHLSQCISANYNGIQMKNLKSFGQNNPD